MKNLFYPPRIFGAIPQELASLERARVVVLPVPYDSTTGYRAGARDGPQAIIDASQYIELYDHELRREICEVGIHTLPEVEPLVSSPKAMIERVAQAAGHFVQQDKLLVTLGGEHSITLGAVQAHLKRYPNLSVLQLDAHTDLRDEYLGTKYSHASVMRRVLELCPIAQVGIRSLSLEEQGFIDEKRLRPYFAEELAANPQVIEEVLAGLQDDVYLTIDLDVLDPSIMSAVGTPEPGGLTWQSTLHLLRTVAERKRIVGVDLVELCPQEGPTACAFLAGKLAYKLMGYATQQTA